MRLEAKDLGFKYTKDGKWIFKDLNLSFDTGSRVCLLGDSGRGKSTLAKLLGGYEKPVEGQVLLDGKPFGKGYRPVQLIHQNPETAINPKFKMQAVISEGFTPGEEIFNSLGIEREWLSRYPSELSGGEIQRFCVARALGPDTRFIIADEISTMLDGITQAQIWKALLSETEKRKIGLIAITHNKDLAKRISSVTIKL